MPEASDYDRLRRRVLWRVTNGLYLLGSRHGDERNLMTLSWATQVAMDPKLVAVAIESDAVTHRLVAGGGSFSLNILARSDREIVRHFAKPAVWDAGAGTIGGVAVREEKTGAPVLSQAAAWLDCEVRHRLDLGSHSVFVGEVVGAGAGGSDDVPVLRMEDTRMNYGG
jgi:flavin reductase (DIM6/NTAB) family NADH-FMN oxidoreductase RutF